MKAVTCLTSAVFKKDDASLCVNIIYTRDVSSIGTNPIYRRPGK